MIYKIYILRRDDSDTIKYVGITSGALKSRLNKHYNSIKSIHTKNKHKINWFNENYGNITIEKIDEAIDIYDAFERERYWIKYYKNLGNKLINKTEGGEGCFGYKHSKETINRISGKNNHRYGKPNLINKERLGHMVEYSNDGINWILYKSIRDASVDTGVSYRFIKKMCNGLHVESREYQFRYHGVDVMLNRDRKKNDQSVRKKEVEVYYKNNWVSFESAKEAAIYFNLKRDKIVMVCNGKRNHTGGLIFRYKKGTSE